MAGEMEKSFSSFEEATRKTPDRAILAAVLVALSILLWATIVSGPFIIDEDNYLVTVVDLQHGRLTVTGTDHLTPSQELLYFDPQADQRMVHTTPVVSLVPPIYAFIALPFSYGGWKGLVLLNIISFLIATYLVFRYVEQVAEQRTTPWIAAALFALGGYCIEYAQGVWPEMLSVALCLGSTYLCFKARKNGSFLNAFFAGALVGIATGVREQNIFFAGCIGVGLLLFGARRVRSASAYAFGVVLLLVAIATLNYDRTDHWHPFPKVGSYTHDVAATTEDHTVLEPLRVFWSKVVDYSSYGPNTAHIRSGYYQWDAASHTILMNGIVKKSWIQSSPWIGLALVAFLVAWGARKPRISESLQELRILGLIVIPTLLMFSVAGFDRTDGLSFNQRYFLELLPLCAIGLGLYLDRRVLNAVPVGIGFLVGLIIVVCAFMLPGAAVRHAGERFIPLLLAMTFAGVWYLFKGHKVAFFLLGACVGWAFFFHVESDLVGSRFRRQINAVRLEYLKKIIPDHSALFTFWGNKDAAGPLQLDRDVVILDVWADGGRDGQLLENELQDGGRRIFILENDMPEQELDGLTRGRQLLEHGDGNLKVAEILADKRVAPN